MAFILRPDSNVTQTSWTNGYLEIDEATASDVDFAYGANNSSTATLEVGLQNPTGGGFAGTCTVRWRHAKVSTGVLSGTGGAVSQTCAVYQGTTLIASSTVTTGGTWTAASFTFDGTLVSDWTDIRLRFTQTASGAGGNARGSAVSWAELEVPTQSYSLTETESGIGQLSATASTIWGAAGVYNATLTATALLGSVHTVGMSIAAALTQVADAELQINNAIRITEDSNRRVTELGDVRVLEGYVASGLFYNESVGLTGALSTALIPSLTQNAAAPLVGSLAQLSASTISASAIMAVSAAGTFSSSAAVAKNLSTSVAGSGTLYGLGGYNHPAAMSVSASGQVSGSAELIKTIATSRLGTASFDFIPYIIRNVSFSGAASGALQATAQGNADVNAQLSAAGTGTGTLKYTHGASTSLTGAATATIYPQFLQGLATLRGGTGVISASANFVNLLTSNLGSTATLNGKIEMIHSAILSAQADLRITESGDVRITENGDFRITSDGTSVGSGTITGTPSTVSFVPGLYAKNNNTWKAVTPSVKRNGTWVTPKVYVNDNGIWKRVY